MECPNLYFAVIFLISCTVSSCCQRIQSDFAEKKREKWKHRAYLMTSQSISHIWFVTICHLFDRYYAELFFHIDFYWRRWTCVWCKNQSWFCFQLFTGWQVIQLCPFFNVFANCLAQQQHTCSQIPHTISRFDSTWSLSLVSSKESHWLFMHQCAAITKCDYIERMYQDTAW